MRNEIETIQEKELLLQWSQLSSLTFSCVGWSDKTESDNINHFNKPDDLLVALNDIDLEKTDILIKAELNYFNDVTRYLDSNIHNAYVNIDLDLVKNNLKILKSNLPIKSELMAIMVGGFATVAGSVMALYVTWLSNIPNIAGHLLAASVMSAPAALMVAKIIYPETKSYQIINSNSIKLKSQDNNLVDAIGRGATDGLKLAANVAAMLIAFISLVAMINFILSLLGTSMQEMLGLLFKPLAWTMGIPWSDAKIVGTLMGEKIVLTELIAFRDLSDYVSNNTISERSVIIASYALCGFANFGSIGIQLGGIGSMAPKRKKDLSKLVFKAMLGGAIASWLTASIVGILI